MSATIMYNNVNIAQYFQGFKIDRSIMPAIATDEITVPRRNGVTMNGYRQEPMEITITAALNAHSVSGVSSVRRTLAKILSPYYIHDNYDLERTIDPSRELILPDDPTISYFAYVTGTTGLDRGYSYPHVSITFRVPSGCGYGHNGTEQVLNLSGVGDYQSYTSVTVDGNVPTYPKIEITGRNPANPTRITRQWAGQDGYYEPYTQYMVLYGDCAKVTIDNDTEEASLAYTSSDQATNNYGFDLLSTFFDLPPGQNNLSIVNGNAKITWKECWC